MFAVLFARFFNTYKKGTSHMSIYIGNHLMIHATSKGKGVKTAHFNSVYWKLKFINANQI
ncbi:NlpC/P60 family protein [Paranoxybacillus vitaminiphilus]|uniref:NlpC/P60 family protein n=1 Tax=Paranoxybacillus vitaminiphilus TaxID=581036 RepID=UPI000DB968BD